MSNKLTDFISGFVSGGVVSTFTATAGELAARIIGNDTNRGAIGALFVIAAAVAFNAVLKPETRLKLRQAPVPSRAQLIGAAAGLVCAIPTFNNHIERHLPAATLQTPVLEGAKCPASGVGIRLLPKGCTLTFR